MREDEAQGLHIARRPGPLDLQLDFECGVPDVGIEEEQPRLEVDFRESQFRINQRAGRIDIQIGGAPEDERILPTIKTTPRGN